DRGTHVRVVGRAEAFHHALEPGWVRIRPAVVDIKAEAESGDFGIAAGAEHAKGVDTIEHPAAQAHRLKHESPGVATRGKFRSDLGHRPLLDECQRPRVFDIYDALEFLNTGNRPAIDV